MWLAVIIMLAIGAFHAYWIAYVRLPPFITTLAGMLIFRGLSNVVLNGRTQSISDQAFKDIFGGVGTVPGVIIGAVLMGVINLGMSIMGIDQNFQKVVKGGVLLAAVVFDVISKRNESR